MVVSITPRIPVSFCGEKRWNSPGSDFPLMLRYTEMIQKLRRFSLTTPCCSGWSPSIAQWRTPANSFGGLQGTEGTSKVLREYRGSRVSWRCSRSIYGARDGRQRRHRCGKGRDPVVKDMLDSSTNLIAQLASGIGEDQDEEVATNKYLQWSLGRRHRRGARRRRVGHRKKRGRRWRRWPLSSGSSPSVTERSGMLPGLRVDWLMGCAGGLRSGKLLLLFFLFNSFSFLLCFFEFPIWFSVLLCRDFESMNSYWNRVDILLVPYIVS
jgi:hypothetical protein